MVSVTDATTDANAPVRVSRKKIVLCGCAFSDTRKWRCCEAINDANWLKKDRWDRKQARMDATAARNKARLAASVTLKKDKNAVRIKKSSVKCSKRRKTR